MAPRKRTHLTVPAESGRDENEHFLHDELTKTTNRPQKFQKKDTHYFDESNVKVKRKFRWKSWKFRWRGMSSKQSFNRSTQIKIQ